MIKVISALPNFGLQKQFKVKNVYFIIRVIDLIGEKYPFLTNTPFLNKSKIKFPQIKQDTIREKHEKA